MDKEPLSMLSFQSSTNNPNFASRSTRVLLVEDEPVVLAELTELVRRHPRLEFWDSTSSYRQTLPRLHGSYDLLVVDKALPDGSGIDLIRELNQRRHQKKSLVMSVFDDRQSVLDAISAGADGYVVKQDPNIADAMCAVLADGNPLSPSITKYLLRPKSPSPNPVQLRPRERETLKALADGMKYHEIAEIMGVSKHTVPDYIKGLYRKLGVHDRSSAVYVGLQLGLISLPEPLPESLPESLN